jgi:hypothetical protein
MQQAKFNGRSSPVAAIGGGKPAQARNAPVTITLFLVGAVVLGLGLFTRAGNAVLVEVRAVLEFYAGVLSLVMLSIAVIVGLVATDRIMLAIKHRVLLQGMHRATATSAVVFLFIHVILKIAESHASIVDFFIPFLNPNRLYVGLGTIASYLMLAAMWTGIIRGRFVTARFPWSWRLIHAGAYVSWPVAVLHGLKAGRQAKAYVTVSYTVLIILVILAVLVRLSVTWGKRLTAPKATTTGRLRAIGRGIALTGRGPDLTLPAPVAPQSRPLATEWKSPRPGRPEDDRRSARFFDDIPATGSLDEPDWRKGPADQRLAWLDDEPAANWRTDTGSWRMPRPTAIEDTGSWRSDSGGYRTREQPLEDTGGYRTTREQPLEDTGGYRTTREPLEDTGSWRTDTGSYRTRSDRHRAEFERAEREERARAEYERSSGYRDQRDDRGREDTRAARSSGYDDPRPAYDDSRAGYQDTRSGYDDARRGYGRDHKRTERERAAIERAAPDRGAPDRGGYGRGGYDREERAGRFDRDREYDGEARGRGGYERGGRDGRDDGYRESPYPTDYEPDHRPAAAGHRALDPDEPSRIETTANQILPPFPTGGVEEPPPVPRGARQITRHAAQAPPPSRAPRRAMEDVSDDEFWAALRGEALQ